MQFDVTILGSNGAIPAYDRSPSSQVINYNGNHFLVDCGEGTQFRMSKFGVKRGKLDHIFISHLHGDHFFGLIGLLTSFNLHWREHTLHIYGSPGLEEIINVHFKYSQTQLRFTISFHTVLDNKAAVIYEDNTLSVETIILKHRIPTTGFLFREKVHLRKIIPEKIVEYNIPHDKIIDIKKGDDFVHTDGSRIPNQQLTLDPSAPRSYAYCSDTIYTDSFIKQIEGIDLLYHEATFAEEHAFRAPETFHSTAKQAAEVAKAAKVGKLLLGHFSARYENLQPLLSEAKTIFPESYLAIEGRTFEI
jgi:ribonuclease Z